MLFEVKVPDLETKRGVITCWFVAKGKSVVKGQALYEIETDKTTQTIHVEFSGTLVSILKAEGSEVRLGDLIGVIQSGESNVAKLSTESFATFLSESTSPSQIDKSFSRCTREKISPIQARMAKRLLKAQENAAIATTFNEVDMSAIIALRKEHQQAFQEQNFVRLGFMSFFVKAVVLALKAVPIMNTSSDETHVYHHQFYDIGIAVGIEKGLVVPIVRGADKLSFAEIETSIVDLAKRAKEDKLEAKNVQNGSFSISNGGVYGSLFSTPILNVPQTGILGIHGIKNRPIAIGEQVQIRPMMYLALSYDHCIVDGKDAITFLKKIINGLENPEDLLLKGNSFSITEVFRSQN